MGSILVGMSARARSMLWGTLTSRGNAMAGNHPEPRKSRLERYPAGRVGRVQVALGHLDRRLRAAHGFGFLGRARLLHAWRRRATPNSLVMTRAGEMSGFWGERKVLSTPCSSGVRGSVCQRRSEALAGTRLRVEHTFLCPGRRLRVPVVVMLAASSTPNPLVAPTHSRPRARGAALQQAPRPPPTFLPPRRRRSRRWSLSLPVHPDDVTKPDVALLTGLCGDTQLPPP